MKSITTAFIGIIMLLGSCSVAQPVDLASLDRVSVQMPQPEVHAILGKPDEVSDVENGLEVHLYRSNTLEPMVGTGCIFGHDQRLVGQSFVFQGEMGKQTSEWMQKNGFTLTDQQRGTFSLLGKDDDTGRPLVVHILQSNGLTIVMTFDKDFFDRHPQ